MNNMRMPKWQKEISSFMGIKSGFILEGNVYDYYGIYEYIDDQSELIDFDCLDLSLESLIGSDVDVIFCDPLYGFYCYADKESEQKAIIEPLLEGYGYHTEMMGSLQRIYFLPTSKKAGFFSGSSSPDAETHKQIWMSEIIRRAVSTDFVQRESHPRVFIMNFASRLDHCNLRVADSNTMFLNLQAAIQDSCKVDGKYNAVILVVDKYNDIPAWLYLTNPNIRTITIEVPDRNMRRLFFENVGGDLREYAILGSKDSESGCRLVAETEGFLTRELRQILELAKKEKLPPEEVQRAFQLYKYGVLDNPWDHLESDIVNHVKSILHSRVKGQDLALHKVERVTMRAVKGLSGLQHSNNSSKPRGILFFAGPTGVGKTETAKALAQAIFGDENACIRFDMSEYREAHSDQKMFGAPPGYVGYEGGGQLTNAIKTKPFSVLLFDEIEKASPTIMDKFLQILEDGRLTDNQGNTVYFGETIILFTSNIGLTKPVYDIYGREIGKEPTVQIEDPHIPDTEEFKNQVTKILTEGVKDYFTNIGRPEILNRIGEDNIIVFQFIDKDAAEDICESKISSICENIYLQKGIRIDYTAILPLLKEKAVLDRKNGGRGVGNMLEKEFLNPFAEYYCNEYHGEPQVLCKVGNDGVSFEGVGVSI